MVWQKLIGKKSLSFSRQELDKLLEAPNYTPEKLIALFERDFSKEFSENAGVSQRYTVKEHTLMVLRQFDRYFGHRNLPEGISPNLFRVILTLHDIGKAEAVRRGDKKLQHEITIKKLRCILPELQYGERVMNLTLALVSGDPIGDSLKTKDVRHQDIEKYTKMVKGMAHEAGLPIDAYFNLLLIYYMVDASSYTMDAGGKKKALDGLFIFDRSKKEMKLAPHITAKIEDFKSYLLGKPGTMWLKDHNWHEVAYEHLADWVKNKRTNLDEGQVFKGAHFRYRRNMKTGKYEIRLRTSIKESLYSSH